MSEITQQNQGHPNASGSIFLSVVAVVLMFFGIPAILSLILVAISSRQIFNAKKAGESKKFIIISYIFLAVSLILVLILSFIEVVPFVIHSLKEAEAI